MKVYCVPILHLFKILDHEGKFNFLWPKVRIDLREGQGKWEKAGIVFKE